MKRPTIADIAQALRAAGFPPSFSAGESRLLVEIARLLSQGRPVSEAKVTELAAKLDLAPDAAVALVNHISEHDQQGNVQGLIGLSLNGHRHRFEVNGQVLSTWCAWDTLFLPPLLKQTARVESHCPATKKAIHVTISATAVERYEPVEAVVSMVIPAAGGDLRSVDQTWRLFCHHVHYFASAAVAADWLVGRKLDPMILNVEEAYRLGRLAFGHMIRDGG